jgi:hypothetical protein
MEHQRRHIELLEVLGEIRLGQDLSAFVGVLKPGLHAPGLELRAIADEACSKAVENLVWLALGTGSDLQHNWGTAAFRLAFVTRAIPYRPMYRRDFSASNRVAYPDRVIEIERLNHGRQIVGGAIHVVSSRSLARSTIAASVMSDRSETVLCEEHQLPSHLSRLPRHRYWSDHLRRDNHTYALLGEKVVPGPVDQHQKAIAETNQIIDMDAQPQPPGQESGKGMTSDLGQHALIAIVEGQRLFPRQLALDISADPLAGKRGTAHTGCPDHCVGGCPTHS